MSTIGIILLVVFVIASILLILLVLVQDDGQNGMGGLLGGRGTAAFGSHSASVLTKATAVLVFLFFALALHLAIINKKPKLDDSLLSSPAAETSMDSASSDTIKEDSERTADSWWNAAGDVSEEGENSSETK